MFNWGSNKNCPFCGGEPEITQAIENDLTSLVATCPDDDCVGSTILCGIDLWNARANEPQTADAKAALDAINLADECYQPETLEELRDHFNTIRAALTSNAAPTDEWRTIDSAPRDGRSFIGYSPSHGVQRDVRFSHKRQDFDLHGWSAWERDWTHWYPDIPLPEPPIIQEK